MKFEGQAIQCSMLEGNILELQFNLKDDSVNKVNAVTLKELREVVSKIKKTPGIQGLLISSAKEVFIVGADVTEFLEHFKKSEEQLRTWLSDANQIFCDLEDSEFPTATAINGFAFGGGFEIALSTDYRVLASDAKVGLPETKLGIFPGWGGTVRLSRLCGADNAIEWIASGEQWKADVALKVGAVDAVVDKSQVRTATLDLLKKAISGQLNWKSRKTEKKSPLKLSKTEATMAFESAKAFVASQAGPHYPSPVSAVKVIQNGAFCERAEALRIEGDEFVKMAKTPVAHSLVSVFLGDQSLKKKAKKLSQAAAPVSTGAVLGAGIMGGGIAYTSASRGVPIFMKDIQPKALDLGMSEAIKILDKQVSRKKLTPAKMGETLSRIRPTLSLGDFKAVDFVIEAVVEKEEVKKAVLAETEAAIKEGTILGSNTSTISITRLAEALKHPENFCGVHFFNPVHRMPLVEVIRGKKTSDKTIATAVAYATAMGKSVVVVNDCAGFLINRLLFPYLAGFMKMVQEGVDFQRMDRVMEKFGWPMGPAYLLDVVGIDTAVHADQVMAEAYSDRMGHTGQTPIQALADAKRYGQKNLKGFYLYTPDPKGPPKKTPDPAVEEILKGVIQSKGNRASSDISDEEIVNRTLLPMIIEASRCLEEKVVESPVEVDLGLIYGLGFPPFRGGALRYADQVGLSQIVKAAEALKGLGKLYEPTAQMRNLAQTGKTFY